MRESAPVQVYSRELGGYRPNSRFIWPAIWQLDVPSSSPRISVNYSPCVCMLSTSSLPRPSRSYPRPVHMCLLRLLVGHYIPNTTFRTQEGASFAQSIASSVPLISPLIHFWPSSTETTSARTTNCEGQRIFIHV